MMSYKLWELRYEIECEFDSEMFSIFICTLLTPLTLFVDLIFSPFEIISLIIYLILNWKYLRK